MGIVHLANDDYGSYVVVKEPLIVGCTSEQVYYNVEKLKVEADVLEGLHHENIVEYVDRRNEGNILYLVVEFIDGEGMYESFLNNALDEGEAEEYILQVLDALVCMHQQNIIHRDLNPKNIMVTKHGRIKVIDFGTVKHYYTQLRGAQQQPTIVFKSGGWTAPEQQYGGIATFQSDIYSTGATLFFLLTGQPPAYCVTSSGNLRPPGDLNPNARRLSNVVMKAMEVDPNKRYQTAEEMKNDIVGTMSIFPSEACIIYGNNRYTISNEAVLGRADDCDIKFPDPDPRGPFISRHHARIYSSRGQYWMEDLNSVNGTFVVYTDQYGRSQYKKLPPSHPWALQDNDLIALCYDPSLGPYLIFKFQKPK
jgi:serine/threonine protein kinase